MAFDDVKAHAKEMDLLVIIKAPNSSGSRGVTVVTSEHDLEKAFLTAKDIALNDAVLV